MLKYSHFLIRYLSYPILSVTTLAIVLLMAYQKIPYWPSALVCIVSISAMVAMLERFLPYQQKWLHDQEDTFTDIFHAIFNVVLILITATILQFILKFEFFSKLWPIQWPIWVQFLLVGIIIDFGLWYMHKLSHRLRWLWKLHAIHHQPKRLYWLNGEKRHPLSAIALATPGLLVLTILGAPTLLIGCWLTFTAVHLSFQHANLDYRAGPLKHVFAVAEVHRWHHKQGFGSKNFAEVFVIWDHIFGTFHYEEKAVSADSLGIRTPISNRYFKQLLWPFKK